MKINRKRINDFILYKIKIPLDRQNFRQLTRHIRILPNFLIIGTQRGGTQSLFEYLMKHKNIFPPWGREAHYFDSYYYWGWKKSNYKGFFPTIFYKAFYKYVRKRDFITGESTPYYLFHPLIPKRVFKMMPNIKIIVLLRNPIDRAYSNYNMNKSKYRENLSFEDAIEREKRLYNRNLEKVVKEKKYNLFHQRRSYLARGLYVEQLKNWHQYFPKEQFLIIKSEVFYKDPEMVLNKVLKFLNQPKMKLKEYNKFHKLKYPKMNENTRKKLIEYFRPYNEALYKYLNINFNWEN